MKKVKFLRCKHCGNLFAVVNDGGVMPTCCGETMELLIANSTDAAGEKHVPVVERNGDRVTVKVGSVAHPMLEEHFIQWVAIVPSDERVYLKKLKPGDAPEATFNVCGQDSPVTAYEYCNLHGLWVAEG